MNKWVEEFNLQQKQILVNGLDCNYSVFGVGVILIGSWFWSVQFGEAAIAANGARAIGALAADTGWSMDSPPIVYLSARLLADRAKSSRELEDFKNASLEKGDTEEAYKIIKSRDDLVRRRR